MSHSKRNTSLAFFTSHERALLRTTWGSQSATLTRDSFLPFGACQLCLLPARDPVACTGAPAAAAAAVAATSSADRKPKPSPPAPQCHLFCRECAVSNLLAQRKEIKRLEKQLVRERAEVEEAGVREDEEAQRRAVEAFERVQMGLEVRGGAKGSAEAKDAVRVGEDSAAAAAAAAVEGETLGKKRKFELDEEELLRIAREERNKIKRAMSSEKDNAARSSLPSYWVPSLTPSSDLKVAKEPEQRKLQPLCPGSWASSAPHSYSLKTLVTVHFTEEKSRGPGGEPVRTCPACQRALNNASKAMMAKPCGHVLCGSCIGKFMSGAVADGYEEIKESVQCFVCSEDLTARRKAGQDGEKDRDKIRPGLVQISSDGTGFAGGGKNLVEKKGVAFQC